MPRIFGVWFLAANWCHPARPAASATTAILTAKAGRSRKSIAIQPPVSTARPIAVHDNRPNWRATACSTLRSTPCARRAATTAPRVMRPPTHTAAAIRWTHLTTNMTTSTGGQLEREWHATERTATAFHGGCGRWRGDVPLSSMVREDW